MKLTNYFLKKKIRTLADSASARDHQFCSLQNARTVLVVYPREDEEIVESCVKKLLELHKQVNRCVFDTRKQSSGQEKSPWLQVKSAADTNLLEIPDEKIFTRFNRIPADILIDLTRPSDYVMHYLILNHPSRFKVGRRHTAFSMHDLAICMTAELDLTLLFGHMLFYLQTIRSK
ncbi:MAG: hypothetical protein LUG96_05355 [Tannerellaceae bacterium]|nr:hypothetical protein [Tannerellaceae bacterium]